MLSISIALATYNGQSYLEKQLQSLADQTTLPAELVVADDGSSDRTMTIIREFTDVAPFPVRILQNQTRLGYRANFIKAAGACRFDSIAFCDQDDIWDKNKLTIMQAQFSDPNILLGYHNATLIDDEDKKIGHLYRGRRDRRKRFPPLALQPWKIIPGFAQVIDRSLVRFADLHSGSIDPFCPGERMPHDQWYLFWASVLGSIAYIPETLAGYRQHGGNTSGWTDSHWIPYIVDHIKNAEFYARGNVIGCRNRIELLQRSRPFLNDDEIGRVEAAIGYYDALQTRALSRLSIYESGTFAGRARPLLALLKERAYTDGTSASYRLDTLLLDTGIGVLFSGVGRSR